jgi:hypothetical protein
MPDVDSDVPEPPEEPEGEPVTAPEAMPWPSQVDMPEVTASSTPTPGEMASGASTGATPTAAPSSSKQLANLLKQVRDEIRSLKKSLSGERKLSGKVEFDPSSGLIRFVDSRVELAEMQNFEDFSS